jgi:PAS domain S-box-containing protein
MDPINELRNLIEPALVHIEPQDREKIKRNLLRLEKAAVLGERKLNRAIQDRQAVHSLIKRTTGDLIRRYQAIFEQAGNPMVVIENDGTITLANTLFCKTIGLNREDVELKKNICDYIAGGTSDPLVEYVCMGGNGQETGSPDSIGGRIYTPDGRTLDVIISTGSIPESTLRIITFVNVSERIRLEQRIVETSNLLSGILRASPVGFHMADTEGKLVYVNETWSAITGYSAPDVMGKLYSIIAHPDDRDQVMEKVRERAQKGEAMESEARVMKPDGTVRWVNAHTVPVTGPDGRLAGWVAAISDITERRATEEALRKSEAQLRKIAESVPGVIYQFFSRDSSEQGTYFVSRQSRAIFGVPEDTDTFIERFTACIPGKERGAFLASIQKAVAAGSRWEYTGRFVRPDGSEMVFRGIAEPDRRENELVYSGVLLDITDIRKAQDALKQSEEKYRFLIENTGDVVYSLDGKGIVTYISPRVRQFGTDPDELIGTSIIDRVHPDDRRLLLHASGSQSHGTPDRITEFRLINPDGKILWVEVNGTVVFDNRGKPTGFQGAMRDITQRKLAQEEARKSEIRFREMADLLPQVIFEIKSNGQLDYFNKFGLELFGISEEMLQSGVDCISYIIPADRDRARLKLENIALSGIASRDIYSLQDKDGTVLLTYIYASPILREGALQGFRGSVIDISELKRVETALREREATFRTLTENIPEFIFSASVDGVISYVSPQVRHLGYTVDDLVGKNIFALIHPADRDGVVRQFNEDIRTTSHSVIIYRLMDRDEVIHWVEQKITLIRDDEGLPISLFGILHDITERKKAEAAIELANRKLNLMNNITRHDILNTITGTFGLIDMLRAGGRLLEGDDQQLCEIKDLVKIIQRQITFTKEYQEVGIRMPQWQNLGTIIKNVRANFENPPFAISVQIGDIEVYADPLFEKVIYNLLDNAVRYADTATQLTFSGRKSERGLILISEDNGVGVPLDQKERIFKRGIGRNTGMGLFLTREILDITGISIRETGTPGSGARFEITVPPGNFREVDESV